MITPSTMAVNLIHRASGWKPVVCSHEELVECVKKFFIVGQSKEYLDDVKQACKGGFMKIFILTTLDGRYELSTQAAAGSNGRLVTIRDKEEKIIYEKDYLFLKKFASAVELECEKEMKNPTQGNILEKELSTGINSKDAIFCPQCGMKCEINDMFCGSCGASLK